MKVRKVITHDRISRYGEKKENEEEEEEEEEIEATDTSRCWRRQILKSGETNNRGVSPEIRSGVGAGGRRSSRSSVGNGKRHVSKSESSCSSANLTREKIRLLYVDYSEQETGKRRGEESFERVEVGAVTTEFCCQSPSWIRFRSIDLNSQHPKIEKRDFFALKVCEDEFDVVLNSMVLNCVAEPEDRGEMLLRMAKMLRKQTGVLFITIPRRCVENNPFCSVDIFNECLRACGLSVVLTKFSPKIAFWVCEKKGKNVANAPKLNRREKKTKKTNSYFSVRFHRSERRRIAE